MPYEFVPADKFTPESRKNWESLGAVTDWVKEEEGHVACKLTLKLESSHKLYIYIYSHRTFQVRFNPDPRAPYVESISPETQIKRIEAHDINVREDQGFLSIQTDYLEIRVNLRKYALSVYRGDQLIHADPVDFNLVYVPHSTGGEAIAQFKRAPKNAIYCGFGEKAGATLDKSRVPRQHFCGRYDGHTEAFAGGALTFFNYDNFGYSVPDLTPEGEVQGPLNPNEPLYQSSPFLIEYNPCPTGDFAGSPYSYGILFDNTSQTYMNFRQDEQYYFGGLYDELDYYFFGGDHPGQVLSEFTILTGRTKMKPKHILGYHQGGYGWNYNDEWKLKEVAMRFRQWKIPIDGLHIDVDFQNNYRTFTNSPKKFPNPKRLFDTLHNWGFKCFTNITPIISMNVDENGGHSPYRALDTGLEKSVFVKNLYEDGSGSDEPFIGNVDYGRGHFTFGHYPDLGRSDVREWWGNQYRDLLAWGLDFIWQDMTIPAMKASIHQDPCPLLSFPMGIMLTDNEETRYSEAGGDQGKLPFAKIRNLYNYDLVKATYEGLERLQPNRRHFIISRGGFVGVHRYAGLWTGDSNSNWEFLRINIPLVLTISLSGQPMSGCDIGGFGSEGDGLVASPELLTRWTILGSFLPWFRNHYDNYSKPFQEPYSYEEPVPTICRKYIEMRYRLIHYMYDAMYQNSLSAMPICRPMFLDETMPGEFIADPQAIQSQSWGYNGFTANRMDDQFFLGRDLLVAPIINPGQTVRPVYLPTGSKWYVYTDNKRPLNEPLDGGSDVNFQAPWQDPNSDNCAVFVRDGAIIPTRELEQYVGELHHLGKENPLTINIYPGKDRSYSLYQDDDGETNRAEKFGEYRLTTIAHKGIPGGQEVRIAREHDNYTPPETYFHVSFLGVAPPKSVRVGKAALREMTAPDDEKAAQQLAKSASHAYYYNKYLKTTFVKVFDAHKEILLQAFF